MHSSTSPPLTISCKSGHWRVYKNRTHSFNDLRHDLREYPILACVSVSPSGRNHRRSPFCLHQSISLQTYSPSSVSHHSRTRTCLDRAHWVVYLQHQLVAFVDSRVWPSIVDAVSDSSCIGPAVINDPALIPEHGLLTVSAGVKIILADVGSTCNVLLLPVGDLAHSPQIIQTTRSRSSTGWPHHRRLRNSLPRTETASLLVLC